MKPGTRQTVSWPLPVFIVDGCQGLPLDAVFGYSVADPFAVSLSFPALSSDDELIVWGFSRELLTAGLIWPSGVGDVHVRPDGNAVAVTLSSPSGKCVLSASREGVGAFLRATYDLVPIDTESVCGEVDGFIAALFSTSPDEREST